ncbi:E3 ubiquitin-protein ligase XIAP-like [Babylonia areolata]|uniref:E3 ubiquitin-protein ligase XIAP-like n=1 Tax=Babylonia areolata TaxID=304850 RepID=UPI003FD5A6EB
MDRDKQPSALTVRPEYVVAEEEGDEEDEDPVSMPTDWGGGEEQDRDLRRPSVFDTPQPVLHERLMSGLIHAPPCIFFGYRCYIGPTELHQYDAERKTVIMVLTVPLFIMVESLCSVLSHAALVVIWLWDYHTSPPGTHGNLTPKEDVKTSRSSARTTLLKDKSAVMHDAYEDDTRDHKGRDVFRQWRKKASADGDPEKAGKGFPERLKRLWSSVVRFDHFRPAPVSGFVFPAHRQQPGKAQPGSKGGERSRSRSSPDPQPEPNTAAPSASSEGQRPAGGLPDDTPWATFRQELYRLGTFQNVADLPVSPLRLAQAGFLRLASNTIVCYFCGLTRTHWSSHESPVQIHRQLSPDCPLVTGQDCDNVAVSLPPPPPPEDLQLTQDLQTLTLQTEAGGLPRTGIPRTGDISEDSSPLLGATGGHSPLPPPSSSSSSSTTTVTHGPDSQPQQPPPPRMGLMGGDPSTADPGRFPRILDGTAQPDPPAPAPAPAPYPPGTEDGRQMVTYEQLGILTGTPKARDMATLHARLASFQGWSVARGPAATELAEAGFHYAGYSDCALCFFCGGGLNNWDVTDDPWIAHAQWFPRCAYLRQCQGQDFVDIVRELYSARANARQSVSMEQVRQEINRRQAAGDPIPDTRTVDPAVGSAVHMGFSQQAVDTAVQRLTSEGQQLSVVRLMEYLQTDGAEPAEPTEPTEPAEASLSAASVQDEVDNLQTENSELRQRGQCKICLDREVSVIFLPCGHLVTCTACAPALRACPLCRSGIKGTVRAFPL